MTLDSLPAEAAELLADWLPANDDPVRPLMTLATVTPGGHPDVRAVLLTEVDRRGFYFHTDQGSTKVAQLAANPHAALTLLWPELPRQLVVRGVAALAPADEVAEAYRNRSPYLQQLAWQNTAAFAALPEAERRSTWAEFRSRYPDGFPQPDSWCGVVVQPTELTFWMPGVDTASSRLRFTRRDDGGDWMRRILPG